MFIDSLLVPRHPPAAGGRPVNEKAVKTLFNSLGKRDTWVTLEFSITGWFVAHSIKKECIILNNLKAKSGDFLKKSEIIMKSELT
jgi:hypothetical protein